MGKPLNFRPPNEAKRLNFRLPDELFEQVNQAVKNGKAKNPSALIRAALADFLKEATEP